MTYKVIVIMSTEELLSLYCEANANKGVVILTRSTKKADTDDLGVICCFIL